MRFSVLPARAIDDARLSRTHLRCLAAICTYTDQNGWAWPSTSTIADKLSVSRQLVSRCLHDLKAWGFVQIRAQCSDNGGQTSNLYRVLFDVGEPVAPPATSDVAPPATSDVAPPATSGGCTNAPLNVLVNAAAARAPARTAAAADAAAASQGRQDQGRRRRGDETIHHGIEIWTPEDERIVSEYIDRYGAARVEEVAKGLPVAPGHVAPYRSALVEAFQKLAKAEAQAAAEADRQALAAAAERRMAEQAAQVDAFLQSLDKDAHAAIVREFGEWLPTRNSAVFQLFRRSRLQSKNVQSEFKAYIRSHYLTQQEVTA